MDIDDFIRLRFHELFHQLWSEKPAWRKGNFYLVDFEKFDVSRGHNGHGTERIVFSKQHILHRNALVLRARSKIAANGRSTVKSENLRNISSAKWVGDRHLSLDPPSITEEKYDSSFASSRVAHYRCLHFCSTGKNVSNGSTIVTINKMVPLVRRKNSGISTSFMGGLF